MTEFEEAQEELEVREDAEPMEKYEAVCQWVFGDAGWAETTIDWLRDAGFKVEPVG